MLVTSTNYYFSIAVLLCLLFSLFTRVRSNTVLYAEVPAPDYQALSVSYCNVYQSQSSSPSPVKLSSPFTTNIIQDTCVTYYSFQIDQNSANLFFEVKISSFGTNSNIRPLIAYEFGALPSLKYQAYYSLDLKCNGYDKNGNQLIYCRNNESFPFCSGYCQKKKYYYLSIRSLKNKSGDLMQESLIISENFSLFFEDILQYFKWTHLTVRLNIP